MRKIVFFLFVYFVSFLPLGADTLPKPIDLSVSNHQIGKSILVYEDKNAKLTIYEVRQLPLDKFTPLGKPVSSQSFSNSAFWYQFKVENNKNIPLSKLIIMEPAWLDSVNITVVSPKGEQSSYQGGNTYPYSKRAIDHFLINFAHTFDQGLSTVYVQVKTRDPFIVSISVMDKSAFLFEQLYKFILIGLIYGGIIAMMFYNLFLWFGIRERYYAYYVFYLLTFLTMNASYNGYTFMYLFADYPNVQNWSQSVSIYVFVLASLFFGRSFLNLKKYHHMVFRLTTYLIYLIIIVFIFSALIGGYRYHVIFSIMSVILMSSYLFGMALFSWLRGNHSARFFLLGATSGLVGAFITALTVTSLIPYTYITYKASDIGMFVDIIFLSMALADRMKLTQEKKLIAEKEAKTDILTGWLNRRAYQEVSSLEYQRLVRHDGILSVIVFDIDNFKFINDSYGHNAGDFTLQTVSNIIKQLIREYDYTFRMGGDEFLLLLPETNAQQALHLAERMRVEVEKQIIKIHNHTFCVTTSFGISELIQGDSNIEAVVKRADDALYQVKKLGKNGVKKYNCMEQSAYS